MNSGSSSSTCSKLLEHRPGDLVQLVAPLRRVRAVGAVGQIALVLVVQDELEDVLGACAPPATSATGPVASMIASSIMRVDRHHAVDRRVAERGPESPSPSAR